jgi:hypothetical protein
MSIEAEHLQDILRKLNSFHAWTKTPVSGDDTPEDVLFRWWAQPNG